MGRFFMRVIKIRHKRIHKKKVKNKRKQLENKGEKCLEIKHDEIKKQNLSK